MTARSRLANVLLVAVLAFAGVSSAEPRGSSAQPTGPEGFPSRDDLELLRMWKLVETLQIDEEQAARVFPILSQHRARQRELEHERRKRMDGLQAQLEEGAPDEALLESIRKVREAEGALHRHREALHEDLAAVLTARQQAQLLLFDGGFRNDLRNLARRLRRAGGPHQGPGWEGRRPRDD